MRFVSYEYNEGVKIGAVIDNGIIDLSDAGPSLKAILATGPLDNLIKVAEQRSPTVDLDHVVLHQVVPDTGRIICVGKNYKDHAKEMGGEVPANPNLFMRTAQSVVGHQQSVIMPTASDQYDFEGELAVVMGRGGRHIPVDKALEYVAGYSCFLDGSVRDYQKHSFTAGKNFDSSGACGPWLVPAREIPDPQALQLTTRVNGEVMQHASTADMIFSVAVVISYISEFTHLEPGDVLATGTPAGVGAGRTPPLWLKPGDQIDVEIENVGTLSNSVKAEAEV
ncbi:MAG: fumarylacetoacetate hydrolase family protein [Rhodospirillaceae bacterium]|jgi:2-keto-4-pentenoate hydratase/2-oxohepta-3-ene-1,7-dioic acid hydratase in catechol pathway|nr:fumarylacetoacetate hydrolase family protein [Rhodospirillaceae bacterium]MBT5566890.1 fumarylacetoacetate hydrolase family protein [Rhodospirillaceae bacterium]MBT6090423.1 fumarylacetoacetate hydrolase family protein [Rhodospirillaceae bacterium]MBT6962361.1 fumarylacetoacetate hydrolase family protein [Rhodospirillaceae bacterium]MBT7449777.1 fumarylacetoacetate hydrolase family protein [Rhodospirillaceae bacterium]